jgi:excisionase family DNA binding protein
VPKLRGRADMSESPPKVVALVPRLALSPDEAVEALGVSRDTLERHIADELRWVRRGRRKLVSVREIEAWLDRNAARVLG